MADLDLLRSFLAIYRAGSISRAAQTAHLTQPALSAHLKALEAQVGRPLFTRKARGVVATPAGHDLARSASLHIDALETLVVTLRGDSGEVQGTLYLGGPAEFLSIRALPALAPLVAQGLELRVQLDLAAPLLERLSAGELDLVIASRRLGARGLEYRPLYEEEFALVAAPSWAQVASPRALATSGPAGIEGMPMLAYADDLPLIRRFFKEGFGLRFSTEPKAVVPDLRALLAMVRSGAGITVLPRYLCEGELRRGELIELLKPQRRPTNTLFLATRTHSRSSRALQLAAAALERAAKAW